MPHFVRNHIKNKVDIVRLVDVGDETNRFRIRHGAWECLGKTGNARKLNDAGFLVIIRTKILGVIIQ